MRVPKAKPRISFAYKYSLLGDTRDSGAESGMIFEQSRDDLFASGNPTFL